MFYQGGIIEHTYIQSQRMSDCLAKKRTVERSVNPENVRMQDTGRYRVIKILKDKYDSSGYTK